jgi:hypothetical protein
MGLKKCLKILEEIDTNHLIKDNPQLILDIRSEIKSIQIKLLGASYGIVQGS